jgi:hypothetical protein
MLTSLLLAIVTIVIIIIIPPSLAATTRNNKRRRTPPPPPYILSIRTANKTLADYLHDFVQVYDIRLDTLEALRPLVAERVYKEWKRDDRMMLKTLRGMRVKVPRVELARWVSESVSVILERRVSISVDSDDSSSSSRLVDCTDPVLSPLCTLSSSQALYTQPRLTHAVSALRSRLLLHHWTHARLPKDVNRMDVLPSEALSAYYGALEWSGQTVAAGYFMFVVAVLMACWAAWKGWRVWDKYSRKKKIMMERECCEDGDAKPAEPSVDTLAQDLVEEATSSSSVKREAV